MTDANYILYTEHFKVIFEYPIARCRRLVTLYQQIDPTMSLEKMVELQTNISGYVQRAIEVIRNTPQAVIPTEYPPSGNSYRIPHLLRRHPFHERGIGERKVLIL